jgi:hypothetical protein
MTFENSTTQVAGSPFAAPEFLPGLYRANPAQTDVFADGLYRLEFVKGGASLNPPLYDTYQLRGGQEAALAPVTTDSASRAASQNDLSLIATTAQVNAARDAVIAAPAFTTGDRATLTALSTRASEERLINLETVARDATAADYRATGFSTPANVSAVTTAVNAARDAVITRGDDAWITATGFATINPDNTTIGRLGALLTGDFTRFSTTALSNAPTGSGGVGGLTSEQNTQLFAIPTNPLLASNYVAPDNASAQSAAASGAALETRLTTQRAAQLDTVVLTTDLVPLATSAQVTAAQAAVIDRGNTAWVTATGFSTVNPDNLTLSRLGGLLTGDFSRFTVTALSNAPAGGGSSGGLTTEQNTQLFAIPTALAPAASTIATAVQTALAPQLTAIATDAIKARAAHTNLAEVDEETATTTVFADNGTTPLFRVRTRDAGGVASIDSTHTREPVALT